jgi:hypothetical protein
MEKGWVTLSVRRSTSVSQTNGILWHECRRISIIHCILVTTMCHQWKSAARLSQNFHYSIILATRMSHQWKSAAQMLQNFHHYIVYSLFGDGEGQGYTVCTSVNICQSNQWNSAARMSQNFHYIVYLGMEKGGVTLSVRRSTSVSQTNGILRHECHRISIIHCILVTTMCHQWKSAARLSQNFHYSII